MIKRKAGLLVIFAEGRPQGYLRYKNILEEIAIEKIFVRKRARRQGFGSQLLAVLQEQYQTFVLEVRQDNLPAIALYKSQGFRENRIRKAYYKDGTAAVEMLR